MHPQDTPRTIPAFTNGIPHYVMDEAGCWLWQGRLHPGGHGGLDIKGQTVLAHRWYYTLHVGPIPDGYYIHHRCHVPWCVNPAHLQAVTPEQHGAYKHPGRMGRPALVPPPRPTLTDAQRHARAEKRFWAHVEKTAGCWLYTSNPRQPKPQFWLNGHAVRASRLVYEWYVGPIAEGLFVCHTCDVPRCVRPDHLFLGTCADNHADRNRKGRQARGDRSGSRTHPERVPRGEAWERAHPPHTRSRGATHYIRLHPETRQGERNGRARLTEEQVITIYRRYTAGNISIAGLARDYGVGWSTIKYVVSGQHWRELLLSRGLIQP